MEIPLYEIVIFVLEKHPMLCLRFDWVIVPSLVLYIYVICCSVVNILYSEIRHSNV
jgi:hypothetical protein